MTRREADRWAKSYAAGLLINFEDSDDVLMIDGAWRDDEDIGRIQEAIRRLATRLARTSKRPELLTD